MIGRLDLCQPEDAPRLSIRSTSLSRSSGRKSRWSRFFTLLGWGTRTKSRPGSRSGAGRISNWSGSSSTTTHPSASSHQRPRAAGSRASIIVCSHSKPILLNLGRPLLAASNLRYASEERTEEIRTRHSGDTAAVLGKDSGRMVQVTASDVRSRSGQSGTRFRSGVTGGYFGNADAIGRLVMPVMVPMG